MMEQDLNKISSLTDEAKALMRKMEEIEAIDVEAGLERTLDKIHARRRWNWTNKLTGWAAILALPLLLSTLTLGYLLYQSNKEKLRYTEIAVARGSIIRHELPDGTLVWLNSGSKLDYPVTFRSDKREVFLSGEGYFEVTANAEYPFYVHTPEGLSTYVYGTKFNVNAYPENSYIETVLEEGKVQVQLPLQDTPITLLPQEGIFYDKSSQSYVKTGIHSDEYTAWKDGKLIFRNTKIQDVVRRLSRHFNTEIELNDHSGKDYKYRATFTTETLPQILDYLSQSTKLIWKEVPLSSESTRKKIIIDIY